MNRRRLWPWLVLVVAGVGMWFGWRAHRRQTAPVSAPPAAAARPAPPVDLLKHDGAAVDFSSGHAVIKDAPADRAAVAREVQAMDEATKDVTFSPAATPAAQTQAASPPTPPPPAKP